MRWVHDSGTDGFTMATPSIFTPPCHCFVFANDGASDIVINLDGGRLTIKGGEKYNSNAMEKVGTFQVVTNAGNAAWRWTCWDGAMGSMGAM